MVAEPVQGPKSGALPAGWRVVTFGEMAQSINERVDNPAEAGVDRYVGLEHLDPDTLHLHHWGLPTDVAATKLRFKPGDVIFGRRRAYQRKLAVADFEGICSAHALVLRARPETVDARYLPVFMQSDLFFKRALEISVGSLSPTINWKTLAVQPFPLPPKQEQRRIADILWAADEAVERWREVLTQSTSFRKLLVLSRFEEIEKAYPKDRLDRLGQIQLGRQRAPKYETGRFTRKYLRVVNVLDGVLDFRDVGMMDFAPGDFERYLLSDGDILITEGDLISPFNVGRSAIFRGEIPDCCFQNTLIRFRVGDRLSSSFAHAALQNAFYRGVLAAVAGTTTVTHLGAGRLSTVEIPVPPIDQQESLAREISHATDAVKVVEKKLADARNLTVTLKRTLLSGVGDV